MFEKFHNDLRKQVEKIMSRAINHAEAVIATQLRTEMAIFCRKLKPSTELRYIDGMGTRFFCIVAANGRRLYVTPEDHYYGDFPGFFCGPRSQKFIQPLQDLLQFVNQMDNDHRLCFGDFRLYGAKKR